jgi:tRNA pseudouridine38-40 synthase
MLTFHAPRFTHMHLKLRIQYDGTHFSGSQLQPEERGRTVQGELEAALARLAGEPVRVALAGRTDSGVHALGQTASLPFPERPGLDTPQAVMRALNATLSQDVAIAHAEIAPEGFHARFSATSRAYRYLFWNAPYASPLLSRYALHMKRALDWDAVAEAAIRLQGTHDFAAFAGSGMGVPDEAEAKEGTTRPSTVRTMQQVRLLRLPPAADPWLWETPLGREDEVAGNMLALDLVANAFLPQMVRTIVGTLLEVGQGKRTVESIDTILESRDRRTAGPTAKPHGLCLVWVAYQF